MPYDNLPESEWAAMDKCVSDVQDQGHDKESAIAICFASIAGKRSDAEILNEFKFDMNLNST